MPSSETRVWAAADRWRDRRSRPVRAPQPRGRRRAGAWRWYSGDNAPEGTVSPPALLPLHLIAGVHDSNSRFDGLNDFLGVRKAEEVFKEVGGDHVASVADSVVVLLTAKDIREGAEQIQLFHAAMLTEIIDSCSSVGQFRAPRPCEFVKTAFRPSPDTLLRSHNRRSTGRPSLPLRS